MEIEIQLTNASIGEQLPAPTSGVGVGAWVEFRGLVRGEESGAVMAALEYEAYSPMAETEMRRIIAELGGSQSCRFVRVIHRVGIVPVGEAAIYVGVGARHRAEAFRLLTEFMNRLKADVPIWKRRALTATELAELRSK